ncbi:Duox2 [Symbiodinium natans]|uniref:Duox2 protein n=1 Tax=Symbiodinium natans TaxID=878477 RepID=A0A812SKX8_9DINO|nr:Duox2 [Symbiodinium natans]
MALLAWACAILGLAVVHLVHLAHPLVHRFPSLARAAWCWPMKEPRCVLPKVTGGACLHEGREVLELRPGESCIPSCMTGTLAGSCTELTCPPSGPEPTCLDDLQTAAWWNLCSYGSECQDVLELGTPRWETFGHFSCGPLGPSACESVVEGSAAPKTESILQSLDTATVAAFCVLALIARFSRLTSDCVSYSWVRSNFARACCTKGFLHWSMANAFGVLSIAIVCLWLCLLPLAHRSTGTAAGLSTLLTVAWAFSRAGVHDYVLMSRENAWRIHYSCGALTIVIGSVHGALNLAEQGLLRVLSSPHWLCGVLSLVAMVLAVLPATVRTLRYDRFKQIHFMGIVGYMLALAHMLGHALHMRTLASVLMAAFSACILVWYVAQKWYVYMSSCQVEIQHAKVTSDRSGEYLFLSLAAKDFSFKPGQWGHLLAVQVSSVPHPFTLIPGEGNANVQIFIRTHGEFTGKLAKACQGPDLPRLKLQGPYGLSRVPSWGRSGISATSRTVFVLGGIGVTPALSLVPVAAQSTKVPVFWSLRSPALLHRVTPLLEPYVDPAKSRIQLTLSPQDPQACMQACATLKPAHDKLDVSSWLVQLGQDFAQEGISEAMIFVCGPPALVAATSASVRQNAGGFVWHMHMEQFHFLPSCLWGSSPSSRREDPPIQCRDPQIVGVQSVMPGVQMARGDRGGANTTCAAFCGPRLSSLMSCGT